jgi:hypothetical protein
VTGAVFAIGATTARGYTLSPTRHSKPTSAAALSRQVLLITETRRVQWRQHALTLVKPGPAIGIPYGAVPRVGGLEPDPAIDRRCGLRKARHILSANKGHFCLPPLPPPTATTEAIPLSGKQTTSSVYSRIASGGGASVVSLCR